MQGGDLSNAVTPRYWVVADTVFTHDTNVSTRKHWWSSHTTTKHVWMPDMGVLSHLWRWSSSLGVRLELVFIGDLASDAVHLWDMLEKSAANPFSDWHIFESTHGITKALPYRPDLKGVIDIPQRSSYYGGKGLQLENMR